MLLFILRRLPAVSELGQEHLERTYLDTECPSHSKGQTEDTL